PKLLIQVVMQEELKISI
ncbi:hypothetical protein CP8484711_1042C, partial [Chlamydia psittaci 84-8471/1]